MRFTEEEKLTIIAEGEKTGVKTVCAKYNISDQTYRDWRYKALGIKPRTRLSSTKRLRVLTEGEKNGVRVACAKYGISDQTYRVWRYKAQGIRPRKLWRYCQKLCIGDRRIPIRSNYLGGLLGLFFTIDEQDASDNLRDQFEALEPALMFLGLQAEFKYHGQGCDS